MRTAVVINVASVWTLLLKSHSLLLTFTDEAAASIMQRMSDMLTRWLEGSRQPEELGQAESEAGEGQQEGQEAEDSQSATRPEGSEVTTTGQSESTSNDVTSQEGTGGNLNQTNDESASLAQDITEGGTQERVSVERISRCSSQTDLVTRMEESCDIASVTSQGGHLGDSAARDGPPESEAMDTKEDSDEHSSISAMTSALSHEAHQVRQVTEGDLLPNDPSGTQAVNESSPVAAESDSAADLDDLFTDVPSAPAAPPGGGEVSQEAVERMRREVVAINQRVPSSGHEPIISLHYSSQGSDSSTIRMDFASTGHESSEGVTPSSQLAGNVEGHVVTQAQTNGNQIHVRVEGESRETSPPPPPGPHPGDATGGEPVATQSSHSANLDMESSANEMQADPPTGLAHKRPHSSTSDGEGLEGNHDDRDKSGLDEPSSEMDTSQPGEVGVESSLKSQGNGQSSQSERDAALARDDLTARSSDDLAPRSQQTGSSDPEAVADSVEQVEIQTQEEGGQGGEGGEEAEGRPPSRLRYSRDYGRRGECPGHEKSQ